MSVKIDKIVTHKYLGYPIFLIILFLVFQATFTLGAYPQMWIEQGVSLFASWLNSVMPMHILSDLVTDGIVPGVGAVLIFLPNILLLYFFLSLMEMTGYMSRAAFIMDRLMCKIGLNGRSFVPLVMGFGCNVPAIMATRNIEPRSARMITILISPLMSCSARLPIYLLFAGIFFPKYAGFVVFMMYIVGVMLAVLMSLIFKRFLFNEEQSRCVIELKPYTLPSIKLILKDTLHQACQYLKKIATTILIGSSIIWALSYFPMYNGMSERLLTPEQLIEQRANSILGRVGKGIEPVMKPLGLDWRASVSLLTGITAKEVVVSTLGILYGADDEAKPLAQRVIMPADDGAVPFDIASAVAFMLFVLIYLPCLGTLTAIRVETGKWYWSLFVAVYTILLAWVVAFVAYQSMMHDCWIEVLLVILLIFIVLYIVNRVRFIKKGQQQKQCTEEIKMTRCDGNCSSCIERIKDKG